jgi:hypothetical protein
MTDTISTNFGYMGFNALSNSENAYNVEQVAELTDARYPLGDSISLACTSTKLLRSVNGLKNVDITPTGANSLATFTGVAMSSGNTALVVGTNPVGATTLPILYSPNGITFTKTAANNVANLEPTCVTWNPATRYFVVGCTSTVAGNAVLVVNQQGAVTAAAGSGNIFDTAAPGGDTCRAVSAYSAATAVNSPVFVGGQLAAAGNRVFGFGVGDLSDNFTAITTDTTGAGNVGSINAIANDNGTLDSTFTYILAGGILTAEDPATTISNLVFVGLDADPIAADAWAPVTDSELIFPTGAVAGANSQVNAIAYNGQYFLVGGLGTVGGATNRCTVAIATFEPGEDYGAAGEFTLAVPTGCNIATLMTNVRSLAWNGLYWIAGGDNTAGFVYARSADAVTWTLIGGAIAGATRGRSVSSRFTPQ